MLCFRIAWDLVGVVGACDLLVFDDFGDVVGFDASGW